MERRESFSAAQVNRLKLRLESASLEIHASNVEEIEALIQQPDGTPDSEMSIRLENGQLTIEQHTPFKARLLRSSRRQLHVMLYLPTTWKGAAEASTVSGDLTAVGLDGADLVLSTISGDMTVMHAWGISVKLQTVSGDVEADTLSCEQLSLKSISGNLTVRRCDFNECSIHSTSGDCQVEAVETFDRLTANSTSGNVSVALPFDAADASLHTVSGRMRVTGVNLADGQPVIAMKTVSGNLYLTRYTPA